MKKHETKIILKCKFILFHVNPQWKLGLTNSFFFIIILNLQT